MGSILYSIGELTPRRLSARISSMLSLSGSSENAKHWLGKRILVSLLISLFAIILLTVLRVPIILSIPFGIILFPISLFCSYTLLYFRVQDRKNQAEKVLPDLLHLIASNISAGVTPIVAFRMSARDEFGPLAEEIKYVTTRSMASESLTSIFSEISKKIKSNTLSRIVELFAASLVAGGNINRLLETTAEDLRETQELKQQLMSGTSMYVIFILFMTVVGMPMLFSVSLQFLEMMDKFQNKASLNAGEQIGLAISSPISSTFLYYISLVTIFITSILASVFISVIHSGKHINGLRYAPFIITASYIAFFFTKFYALKLIFGL